MYEWHRNIQKIVDYIDQHLTEDWSLSKLSGEINYSAYYCTRQFKEKVGITLREYIQMRRLADSVLDLRDTGERVTDIALKYRFNSTEAYSRAFKKMYGISPRDYRVNKSPMPLFLKRNVFDPYFLGLNDTTIAVTNETIDETTNETTDGISKDSTIKNLKGHLSAIKTYIQVLPEHVFVGVCTGHARSYVELWEQIDAEGKLTCDFVCGYLQSLKSFNGQIGAWFESRGYAYGIEVDKNLALELSLPEGFFMEERPEQTYVVYHHPMYDYLTMDAHVFKALWEVYEKGKRLYRYKTMEAPIYQRHSPEMYGQAICVPIEW